MTNLAVPDLLAFATVSRAVSDLKKQADVTRTESVTGRVDDVTAHLKGDVGSAHLVKKAVDDVRAYQENLSLAEGRSQATQTALNNFSVDSNRIATDTLSAIGRGDTGTLSIQATDARSALSSIFAGLNSSFGGRALFGGDETNRPPLTSPEQLISDVETIIAGATDAADAEAQLDTYFNDPAGGFATNIYQGGAGRAPLVEIAPGIRVDTSARADDQPIKDMIRGLVSIATSPSATFADRNAFIETSANRTLGADVLVTEQRAGIGANEARIVAARERYDSEETILVSLYNDKTARDPYEAASELRLLETQLEAAYLLTSRLARLSLSNYLR